MTQWTKNWWAFALRAALAIVAGIVALIWPGVALTAIVTLFGLYAMADGVFAIAAAVRGLKSSERWGALLFEGFVGVAAGAAALFWPGISALALTYLVAGWALVTGTLEIAAAVRLRKVITGEWLLIVGGLLSILFAVVVVAYPGSGWCCSRGGLAPMHFRTVSCPPCSRFACGTGPSTSHPSRTRSVSIRAGEPNGEPNASRVRFVVSYERTPWRLHCSNRFAAPGSRFRSWFRRSTRRRDPTRRSQPCGGRPK